jgi:hypothetical protein
LDNKATKDRLAVKYLDNNNDFQKSFQKLKSHFREHNEDFEKLQPDTKKLINKVVEIESSKKFRLTRHFMNRLDIFSRFWFPIIYILWLNISLFMLDNDLIRFSILNLIIFALFFSY